MVSMKEGTLRNLMAESNDLNSSQRRRSPRLSSPPQANVKADSKMALASVAVKRSITVRKIAPRKTVAPSEHNKENVPRRSVSESSQQKKPQVFTPGPVPGRGGTSSAKKKKKEAVVLSPILPSSPPAPSHPQQPAAGAEDAVWSQKVRRSYSRLGDKSFNSPGDKSFNSPGDKSLNSPDSLDNLFGFDKLQTPEVAPRVLRSKTGLEASCAPSSALNSFTSLLEAEDSAVPEPDLNIPGVVVVKEKRSRRKKVQQIGTTELDALAAQLNAEFDEAEEFELLVE
ncbi:sororin [Cyclopterus lumpus]|uniref:Cell division cycle associated 5 n=1 Tax=Cyclopterus lumpus TaxID=8103 RepID=A0A8C3AXP8_CYCLU|nr:sororin [Cyclopterus lumpus]